jgi:hypothetical protein
MSRLFIASLLRLLLRLILRPKGAQHLTTSDGTSTLDIGERVGSEGVFRKRLGQNMRYPV